MVTVSFVVLLFAYSFSQFYRAFLAVISGDLTRDLGMDAAALGSLSAAWLLAFALAQIPIGMSLDRYGPRLTLVVFMSAAIAGSALLGVATSHAGALAAFALLGVGSASNLMAAFYFVARTYPVRRFAALSSVLIGIGSLGDPLSGAPLAFTIEAFGWRHTMLAAAVVTAACIALVGLTVRDPPRLGATQPSRNPLAGLREVVALRQLWPILPLTFCSYAVIISVRGLWISPYLRDVQGLDGAGTGIAATGMGLVMAAGTLIYPAAARLLGGAKESVLLGTLATACLFLALAAAPAASPGIGTALVLALGGCGMTYAMIMAHARSFLPVHALGAGVTLMNLAFVGGSGLLQWLSGRFVRGAAAIGLDAPATYSRLFLAFGAVLLVAAAIYAASQPERREQRS